MLFELLPYPMDIVITFLKPSNSKFYITQMHNVDVSSKNQRHVTSTSGKVGGARLRRFMVITLSKCNKNYAARPGPSLHWHCDWVPGPRPRPRPSETGLLRLSK